MEHIADFMVKALAWGAVAMLVGCGVYLLLIKLGICQQPE